ncbi:MAG TPA: glutamate ABC transporter substrate-binding protein [Tepidiformaceae bacterium]
MKPFRHWTILLVSAIAMIAMVAAACGGDDDDDDDDDGDGGATPAATFAPGSTMAQIKEKGKIVIGVKYDQPGFGQLDPTTRKVDGFDVAIGKEIAKALGLSEDQIEFVEAVSRNRIPFLQEDKVDLVIATMTINAERKEQIEFSRPYFKAGQSILVLKDNDDIKSVDDLNGKKVCSVQGSTSEKNVKEKAPQSDLLALDAYASCVSAMKDGRVVAVSTDDIILAGYAAADSSLKLVGGQFTEEPYGIGIKKGKTDMQEFVDGVLNQLLEDGTWDEIYDQFLGEVEGLPTAEEAREDLPDEA